MIATDVLRTPMSSDPDYIGCDRTKTSGVLKEVASMEEELLRLFKRTSGDKRHYTSAMFLRKE